MSGMEQLEQQLRETFRRVDPPAGLEQKILRRLRPRAARPWPAWAAVAAGLLIAVGGSLGWMRWQEQRLRAQQAEQVRQQLELALRLTARTLARTEGRLKSIGVQQIQLQEASWQD
ncbi:MAG: hypothetical protein ACPL7M_05770 [Bryobacteraceae bacterium]